VKLRTRVKFLALLAWANVLLFWGYIIHTWDDPQQVVRERERLKRLRELEGRDEE
jgi:hypothetical protein